MIPAGLLARVRKSKVVRLGLGMALTLPACGAAQQEPPIPPAVRAAAETITRAHLRRDVDYLASDLLRGRATPSPGLDSAAAFVIRRLTELQLTPAGDSGTFRQHYAARSLRRVTRSYNVVAMLEGSDPTLKAEVVTLAAHLDGAVDAQPVNGDSIYNAADDNASGSAGLLAVAEAMTRAPRPKRSVIFIWDTGEETGLLGTNFFVTRPPVPVRRIVLHINVDMIGRSKQPGSNVEGEEQLSGPGEVFVVGPRVVSTELDSLVEQTNRAAFGMKLNHRFDVATHEFFYPRTDAAPFLERGVPTLDFFTGEHADYHLPSDEAGKLDDVKMEQVSRTVFLVAWRVADMPRRLRMDKGIPASVPRRSNGNDTG